MLPIFYSFFWKFAYLLKNLPQMGRTPARRKTGVPGSFVLYQNQSAFFATSTSAPKAASS